MAIETTQRSRARLKHLLSYLLISTLPILLCGGLMVQNAYIRRTEQADATVWNGLKLFSATYSALLGSMDSCAGHLADNLARYDSEGYAQLPSQLSSYQKNYTLFTGVLYYQKGSRDIYTGEGGMHYHLFETQFQKTYGVDLNMTTLFSKMNSATENTVLRSRAVQGERGDGEILFYLRPVPTLDASPRGVIVFIVSSQTLRSLLEECVPASYSLYLYSDQYLSWLFRSDPGSAGEHLQERLNRFSSTGYYHERVMGREHLLLRAKSDTDNMYHMMAYDCGQLYSAYRSDRARMAGMLMLLLPLIAIAAYFLHRYMYTPIDTILDLPLPQSAEEDGVSGGSDALLGGVARRAMRMIDQNEKLQEQIEDQKAQLLTQHLTNLVQGGMSGDAANASVSDIGGQVFPHALYTAAYAEIAAAPESARGEAKESNEQGVRVYVVPMRISGQLAIIVNHDEADRASIGSAVLSALTKLGVSPARIGIGLTQRRVERVPISLTQAQAVARSSETPAQIAYFADDEEAARLTGFLPFSGKLLLCQCIRNGKKEIALSTLHQMRADILPLSGNDTILRSWCFFLFDAVAEALREHHMEELLHNVPVDELLCLPQEEFLSHIERIVGLACERIGSQDERLMEEKQASMLRYVDERFCEQGMSLSRLSEEFALSESYITRFFKQETGMSFLQYVSQLRMDRVREQLVSTDRPIKDIVSDVGYVDIANFTRKFRQIEGVTPGAYRQQKHTVQNP